MATVFMIFGGVGVGKTTYARELEATGAVRLSLDEWTIAATGDQVHVDRQVETRVFDQLMRLWPEIARRGLDVLVRDKVRETSPGRAVAG